MEPDLKPEKPQPPLIGELGSAPLGMVPLGMLVPLPQPPREGGK